MNTDTDTDEQGQNATRQERDQLANQLKATVLELMEARATIENLKHHLNGYKK